MLSQLKNIEQLSERVIRVLGCNPSPMTLQGTNTYLVGTGKSRLLIDTGNPDMPEYTKNLNECLKSFKCSIDAIILTHWHIDHVGGINDVLRDSTNDSKSVPLLKLPLNESDKPPGNFNLSYTPLKDGELVSTEGATLRVIHTPGHTQDHVSLELLEEKAIFSADCVLGEGTAVFEDLYDYMRSLQVLLNAKPKVMYPGHGKVIDDPVAHITHYIQHRNARERQIIECLKQKSDQHLTSMDIVRTIYTEIPDYLHPAADKNVNNHLQKLLKEDQIESDESGSRWKIKPKL